MILICFGTRPEWLKIKPLLSILNRTEYKTLFTGQHTDLLSNIDFDYITKIDSGSNRLDGIISSVLDSFPQDKDITSVLVQGDTASAFACSIAAFHRKLKLFYLESGLRTRDLENPYPEEGYRQMISRIADINFCPTQLSADNLESENILGKMFVVGNTVLDNIVNIETSYTNKVLVTLHRRENHSILDKWFIEIENLAVNNPELEFILPIHPNPDVKKHRYLLDKTSVINPLEHSDLINLLKTVKIIITDSGGIQEEGAFLNKRIIVCRKETERPEGIDTGHTIMCTDPEYLNTVFNYTIKNYSISNPCPYGDGHSSKRIVDVIRSRI